MDFHDLRATVNDQVGTITLNRPAKKNALTTRLLTEITGCLSGWANDSAVRAVVFHGEGACFCAGFDRAELLSGEPGVLRPLYEASKVYHRAVWHFPKPTIAAVAGYALGGGFDLAALCDLRLAAEGTMFGHPEVKFGAPPLATPLRWIVGDGWARDLCLRGRRIDAQTALRIGLVTEVVEPGALLDRAHLVAQEILEAPDLSLAPTKAFFLAADFEAAFVREHDAVFEKMLG